jgi:hypothetical protein
MPRSKRGSDGHCRFAASAMTFSLPTRLVVTGIVGLLGLFLFLNLLVDATEEDPRPAALVLFLFLIWAYVASRFLHHMWRSNIDWAARRRSSFLEAETICADLEAKPRAHPSFAQQGDVTERQSVECDDGPRSH